MKPETRKKIEKNIIKWLDKVDISGENSRLYKELFKTMKDDQLVALIKSAIPIYEPAGSKVEIDHVRNIEIARELGYEFRQRLWLTDEKTGQVQLTNYKHFVLDIPVRRQSQIISKKMSVAEHGRNIDHTTGQTVGKQSKSSGFSFPQTFVMYTKGYDETLKELIKTRGGDIEHWRNVERNLRETGESTINTPGSEHSTTKSVQTMSALLKAMHIGNNIMHR